MGAARDHQNPDERHGYVPKLILAGRLTGTLAGRPVVIQADDSGLVLSVAAFRTAWTAWRTVEPLLPILQTLRRCNVPLRVHVAGLFSFELLPKASGVLKLLVPALHRLGY